MKVRRVGVRSFLGCDRYPGCRNTKPLPKGVRLERLDGAVAETERQVRELTKEAEDAVTRYDYARVTELLERAEKRQAHNEKLIRIIDRTERKLAKISKDLAKELGGSDAK